MTSIKATLSDIIGRHFDRALCQQTEEQETFSLTTECIDIADTSGDFLCLIIAAAVDKINEMANVLAEKEYKLSFCHFLQVMNAL